MDTYNGILFGLKKEENPAFATRWMNLEDTTLGEISQVQKVKYCVTSLLRGT